MKELLFRLVTENFSIEEDGGSALALSGGPAALFTAPVSNQTRKSSFGKKHVFNESL